MRRAVGVSRSGYYEWRDRPASKRAMADRELLRAISPACAVTGGVRRLQDLEGAARATAWRAGAIGSPACAASMVSRRGASGGSGSWWSITSWPLRRQTVSIGAFRVARPDRVWAGDMTVIPTRAGWLHLAVLLDLYSRRVVGWAMGSQRTQALSLAALRMALDLRQPDARLIHHSKELRETIEKHVKRSRFLRHD